MERAHIIHCTYVCCKYGGPIAIAWLGILHLQYLHAGKGTFNAKPAPHNARNEIVHRKRQKLENPNRNP